MKIAYTMGSGRGDTDLLLAGFAEALAQKGVRCAGTVQINTDCGEGRPCDMDVRLLPDGPVLRISQSLGPEARGCRLNPDALERSVAQVAATLDDGAQLLIVNKFGKQEADGRGFRDVIAAALERDIPVLVGLNKLNAPAFSAFTAGMGEALAPTPEALAAWSARVLEERL